MFRGPVEKNFLNRKASYKGDVKLGSKAGVPYYFSDKKAQVYIVWGT
jgi:hypothetical protein